MCNKHLNKSRWGDHTHEYRCRRENADCICSGGNLFYIMWCSRPVVTTNVTNFTHLKLCCVHRCRGVQLQMWMKYCEAFCGSRRGWVQSDKSCQVMPLISSVALWVVWAPGSTLHSYVPAGLILHTPLPFPILVQLLSVITGGRLHLRDFILLPHYSSGGYCTV